MNSVACSAVYRQGLALVIAKKLMVMNAKAQRKSIEAQGENAQSSAETGVWIKRTKQDFEPNEKQQNTDNGAGQVYSSTALRHSYMWTSIHVDGVE